MELSHVQTFFLNTVQLQNGHLYHLAMAHLETPQQRNFVILVEEKDIWLVIVSLPSTNQHPIVNQDLLL